MDAVSGSALRVSPAGSEESGGLAWGGFGIFRAATIQRPGEPVLALIFGLQVLSLVLVLMGDKKTAAVGCFWSSLVLTLFWFAHHATDSLGISL